MRQSKSRYTSEKGENNIPAAFVPEEILKSRFYIQKNIST
jgi:hypothetical protein